MFNVSRSPGLYALLFCCWPLLISQAHAFDLNGAWATNEDQCSKIFVKKPIKSALLNFPKSSVAALSRMEMTSEAKLPNALSSRGKKRAIPSIFRPHAQRKSWRQAPICVSKSSMPTPYPAFSRIRLWREWSLPFTVARCNLLSQPVSSAS